jgi:hypothetical protein
MPNYEKSGRGKREFKFEMEAANGGGAWHKRRKQSRTGRRMSASLDKDSKILGTTKCVVNEKIFRDSDREMLNIIISPCVRNHALHYKCCKMCVK